MAAAHDEYHNNVEEYFPINDPVKGKRNFNRKSAGAVGVMLTASAGIIAAALTLLLLFCSATAVSPSSASFQTTVCNADDSTQIHYYVVPYDAVSQNPEIRGLLRGGNAGMDTAKLVLDKAVASGAVSAGSDAFQVDGLEPGTRYYVVFFNSDPDGVQFLNAFEFSTKGPDSNVKLPGPGMTEPAMQQGGTSSAPAPTEKPKPTEEPKPTEAPQPPYYYPEPPREEPAPPSSNLPQGNGIDILAKELLSDLRTRFTISTVMNMKGYSIVDAFVRVADDSAGGYDEIIWEENGTDATVTAVVYLSAQTSVQIVAVYDDQNGGTAEVSSQSADLVPFDEVAALGESGDVVAYALRNPVPADEDSTPAEAAADAEENSAPAEAAAGTEDSNLSTEENSAPVEAAAGTEDSNLGAEENSAPVEAAAGTGDSTVSPSEDAAAPTENVEAEL